MAFMNMTSLLKFDQLITICSKTIDTASTDTHRQHRHMQPAQTHTASTDTQPAQTHTASRDKNSQNDTHNQHR